MATHIAHLINARCLASPRPVISHFACFTFARTYATRGSASDLLSQTLDVKRQTTRKQDSVGPFGLGVPPSAQSAENVKKWSQLGTGGKVMRTTARTSNLLVILFGAGFSAVLIYALTSELFSKNSPTVLHSEACKLIEKSPRIARYLNAPLSFHNNPPSTVRPRHRNRHVMSQRGVDSWGREHMLLNFYVQGSERVPSTHDASESYINSAVHWTQTKLSHLADMSFDDIADETKARASRAVENSKSLFKFLSGESALSPQPPLHPSYEPAADEKKDESVLSNLMALFTEIKGKNRKGHENAFVSGDGRTYTEGEVRADCILNNQGYYEFQSLEVYIPSSRSSNPIKVQLV